MSFKGDRNRSYAFGVERWLTIFRIYRDRAQFFLKLSLIAGVVSTAAWLMFVEVSSEGRANFGNYAQASWWHWQTIETPIRLTVDGESQTNTPTVWHDWLKREFYGGKEIVDLVADSLWAGGVGTLACFAAFCYFSWPRRPDEDDEIVKGRGLRDRRSFQQDIDADLRKRTTGVDPRRRAPKSARPTAPPPKCFDFSRLHDSFDLGGIRIPKAEEQKHILILGDTGAGKSSILRWHLHQIRERGEPAIIVDLEREFIQTFYEPDTDVILNPTDARMPPWTPGLEVETIGEAESLAVSLIPGEPNGLNNFFTSTARAAFVDILAVFDRRDPGAISRACAMPLEELHALLRGRPSASALSPNARTTAENVRATLQSATRGLGLLPAVEPRRGVWTLKEWAANPRGWIFLTSLQSEWEATKPLVTAWLDILIRHMLDRPVGSEPLVHVVVDELAALGRCPRIVDINTRGRKRGIAAKIATQTVSQIEKLYDKDARTILSQPKTKLTYRCSEPDLAEWASKLIGSVERRVERVNLRAEIASRGQDSVSLSDETRVVPLVLPIELQQLEDFKLFVTHGGVTTFIEAPYTRQLQRRPPYIPRRAGQGSTLRDTSREKGGASGQATNKAIAEGKVSSAADSSQRKARDERNQNRD